MRRILVATAVAFVAGVLAPLTFAAPYGAVLTGCDALVATGVPATIRFKVERNNYSRYDLKSVKLKRGNPPAHPSWRAFDKTDKTFRIELRDKDYAHYQLIMRRRS